MSRPIDVARAREETRGIEAVAHLNNAGASLMPIPVADALHEYLAEEERRGGYETEARRREELENLYRAVARLIGCAPEEVAYVENATRAWDMAFYALPLGPGDRVLTSPSEYGSNMIAYLHHAGRRGFEVEIVPPDETGQLDVAALERMIDERVKLISVSHIPTGGGLVNPAAEIGRVARAHGVPYLLDACQSVGQMPVDVDELGCDMLSATGRKYLRGPRGTGFLYVRRAWIERLDPPLLDQHAADLVAPDRYEIRKDARRFENWESYCAGKAALGVAIDYARGFGLDAIRDRVFALAGVLRDRLAEIPGVTVTDEGAVRCGIVTFTAQGRAPDDIVRAAAAAGVNVSVSRGSGMRVAFARRGLDAVVRASVHYYNTEEELDRLTDVVAAG